MFHCFAVKWCVELFQNQPFIFQCVPDIVSHLYYYGQSYLEVVGMSKYDCRTY